MMDYFKISPTPFVEPPAHLNPWLKDKSSFINRLKKQGISNVEIVILKQQWEFPTLHEREKLVLGFREQVLIREVLIKSVDKEWMVARTVFPQKTLTGNERQFIHLKTRSLGSILFKDKKLYRSDFEFFCVKDAWGRRSLFKFKGKRILLTELFLPDMLCF